MATPHAIPAPPSAPPAAALTARAPRVPLTPRWLLARDLGARTPAEQATAAMLALRALAAHEAALDLAVGAALDRLMKELGGAKALGHSHDDDFARAPGHVVVRCQAAAPAPRQARAGGVRVAGREGRSASARGAAAHHR